jgi:hypothetical protein
VAGDRYIYVLADEERSCSHADRLTILPYRPSIPPLLPPHHNVQQTQIGLYGWIKSRMKY